MVSKDQERQQRSCCGVRVSLSDKNNSAPLQLAEGFLSVRDLTLTETNLFCSPFY